MSSQRISGVALVVLALACVNPDVSPAEGDAEGDYDRVLAEMGAEVYVRRCASCHGVSGTGDGPVTVSLKVPPSDLTRIAERRGGEFPAGEIARFIDGRFDVPAHGSREMPVWGKRFGEWIPEASVSEEIARGKIATLLEYLESIQRSSD
jgi:mono/diheme cytochrome c family protein